MNALVLEPADWCRADDPPRVRPCPAPPPALVECPECGTPHPPGPAARCPCGLLLAGGAAVGPVPQFA